MKLTKEQFALKEGIKNNDLDNPDIHEKFQLEEDQKDATRQGKEIKKNHIRETTIATFNSIHICPQCGYFSSEKREILLHFGRSHTYSQSLEFGYQGIYSLIDTCVVKELPSIKCAATGQEIHPADLYGHTCSHQEPQNTDPHRPICHDIFTRVQFAVEKV